MNKLALAAIFLGSLQSSGEEVTFKYGLGFGQPNQDGVAETKYISFGYQNGMSNVFDYKLDLGAWFDSLDPDKEKRSSGFASSSIGVRVNPNWFYAETFFGVSYITQVDTQLSTQFEFTEELGIGIKDEYGKTIGFEYRHFSNAGIALPNKGRDFFLVNVGVPL